MSNAQTAGQRPKLARAKTFDLDALTKDPKAPKPLPVTVGGEEYIFGDLDEGDFWNDVASLRGDDIEGQFRVMLGDEQFERFRKHPMKGWKVRALYEHLDDHFGFTKRMGNQGEDDASSGS